MTPPLDREALKTLCAAAPHGWPGSLVNPNIKEAAGFYLAARAALPLLLQALEEIERLLERHPTVLDMTLERHRDWEHEVRAWRARWGSP